MFSDFLRSLLRYAKASAKPFTVNFLRDSSFSSPAVSFSLASSLAMRYFSSTYNSSLVSSSGTASRSSSMSSSSTPRLKFLAISTKALLMFATSSSLANP